MNTIIKQALIIITSLAVGYVSNSLFNSNKVTLEQTRSGAFVITKGRIFRLYEISNNEPSFVEDFKQERGSK